jgi:hypothetical protein
VNHGNLSASELLRGWVEYHCPVHGFLAAALPDVLVTCACGKRAAPYRQGRALRKRDIKALQILISKNAGGPLAA